MNLWGADREGTVGHHARQGQGAAGAVGVHVHHAIGFDRRLEGRQHLIPGGSAWQTVQAGLHGVGVCHSTSGGVRDGDGVRILRTQQTGKHHARDLGCVAASGHRSGSACALNATT